VLAVLPASWGSGAAGQVAYVWEYNNFYYEFRKEPIINLELFNQLLQTKPDALNTIDEFSKKGKNVYKHS